MSKSPTEKIIEILLSGLLAIRQLRAIEVEHAVVAGTSPTRVCVRLNIPGGNGGAGLVSLDMWLPIGEMDCLECLHSLNLTLAALTATISTKLDIITLVLDESQSLYDSLSDDTEKTDTVGGTESKSESSLPKLQLPEEES